MTLSEREREIERTRERLNDTIGKIQDRLTVSGIVDEVLGTSDVSFFETRYARVLASVRANPVPVLLIAAGLGWALTRLGRRERLARVRKPGAEYADLPVNDGHARLYDPDRAAGRDDATILDGRRGARG